MVSFVVTLKVAYTIEFLEVGKNGSAHFPPCGVAKVKLFGDVSVVIGLLYTAFLYPSLQTSGGAGAPNRPR